MCEGFIVGKLIARGSDEDIVDRDVVGSVRTEVRRLDSHVQQARRVYKIWYWLYKIIASI